MLRSAEHAVLQPLYPGELAPFRAFCAEVGSELAWVQGPGGNASLKHEGVLWVKASGTWLARALEESIFVPVALPAVCAQIERGDDQPVTVLPGWQLRPSLETTLHGLMPQRYVLHIHSIAALTWAVRADARARIAERLDGRLAWQLVPYARPGAQLTAATRDVLRGGSFDYLVLANHGVLLGAETLAELRDLLQRSEALLGPVAPCRARSAAVGFSAPRQYRLVRDERIHALACELLPWLSYGALYPDHTVFLGPVPIVAQPDDVQACIERYQTSVGALPEYLVVAGCGVCVAEHARPAVEAMLACWALVLSGLQERAVLAPLCPQDNAELVSWEAETYRRALEALRR